MKTNRIIERTEFAGWCVVAGICASTLITGADARVSALAVVIMAGVSATASVWRLCLPTATPTPTSSRDKSAGLDPVVNQRPKLSRTHVVLEGTKKHFEALHSKASGIEAAKPSIATALEQVAADPTLKHLDLDCLRSFIAMLEKAVALDDSKVSFEIGLLLRYHGQQITEHARSHERFLEWYLSTPRHLSPAHLSLRQVVDDIIARHQ